jgi:hypothetical protein
VQNQGRYYSNSSSVSIDTVLIRILERDMTTGVIRPLDPFQSAVNIMGTCVFYFIGAGNIQQFLQGKRPLSKSMLEQHSQEAIALVMAGVRQV